MVRYPAGLPYWRVTFADDCRVGAPWPRLLLIQHHRVESPRYRLPAERGQWPARWAFKYTLDGRGEVELPDGSAVPLPPGRGVLFRLDDGRVRPRYPAGMRTPWTWLTIQFSGADPIATDLVARRGHVFEVDRASPALRQAAAHRRDDGRCLRLSAERTAARVHELLAALAASGARAPRIDPVDHILAVIAGGVGADRHVAGIAREVGLHPDHCSRLVRERTGLGLKELLQRQRFDQACELLRDTDLPVTAIAERCGFATASSFGRSFRQRFGCAPGAWRIDRGK